jgi:hypothetical protein
LHTIRTTGVSAAADEPDEVECRVCGGLLAHAWFTVAGDTGPRR